MSRERFYIGQYGYFWSFSRKDILALFAAAINNGGEYDLPGSHEIKRPKGIQPSDSGYWSGLSGPSGRFFQPLDWDADAFQRAITEIEEYAVS